MIKYHGLPVSGGYIENTEFSKNKHVLVSFAHPEPMPLVHDTCDSFCLDNGAFTMWRKKKAVDWDKFVEWIDIWGQHPRFDFCFCPDKIDGTLEENQELMNKYMSKLKNAVPIYHLHEPLEWAAELVKYAPRIAIGSSGEWPTPGTNKWWERMSLVMEAVCDSNGVPQAKLHGLRMLNPKVFTRLPLSSADSCNAAVNAGSVSRFKAYLPPKSHMRASVIAANIEMSNSASFWTRNLTILQQDIEPEQEFVIEDVPVIE